ncbi:SET domain-containing protein 2 [Elsinoe fawcettii]|nr:SET domain-containing protein 2 [Elsinoe fawcettii]
MASQDQFSAVTARFADYFHRTQPFVSEKIELADLRGEGRGRGVVAKSDIDQDEDLFSVSRSGILSAETSGLAQTPEGQQLLVDLDDSWLALILILIYEQARPDSPWADYISTLKDADLDTLMYWQETDLAELQASAIKDKIGKTGADETFQANIVPAVRKHQNLFPPLSQSSDDDILVLAHWAGSTIMAYAFDIEKQPSAQAQDEEGYVSDEEDQYLPKGMVPMADMLNADADRNNARLFYEEDRVVMRTIKPVKAGEELFNDYGPLPRAELLRRYGYITNNYAKYDVVELSTPFIIETVKTTLTSHHAHQLTDEYLTTIEEALEEKDYWEDGHIISAYTEEDDEDPLFPHGLQMLIYRLIATPGSKYAKRPEKIEAEDRNKMNSAYHAVLQARLQQYGTTVSQDQDILQQTPPQQKRKIQAIHVRMGEKRLLQHAMNHISPQSNTDGTQDDSRPAKRTKLSNGH